MNEKPMCKVDAESGSVKKVTSRVLNNGCNL